MNASEIVRLKALMPTELGSDEIRASIASDVLRRSVFSARVTYVPFLEKIRDVCAQIATGAMNQADARNALEGVLEEIGHGPADGGGLSNPASIRRLNLIVDTQRQMAASVSNLQAQTPATLDMYPGWELMRFVGKKAPRADWAERWRAAGESVGWEGASRDAGGDGFGEWSMVALKSSPIWAALGRGAGGFRDTLGNPYPPFAHGSGLAWEDVERDRCEALGLLAPGEEARGPDPASLAPSRAEVDEASGRAGFDMGGGL